MSQEASNLEAESLLLSMLRRARTTSRHFQGDRLLQDTPESNSSCKSGALSPRCPDVLMQNSDPEVNEHNSDPEDLQEDGCSSSPVLIPRWMRQTLPSHFVFVQLHPEETVEDGATEATGAGPQALDLQHSACEEGSGVLEDRPLLDYPQSQGGLQQWKRRDTMPSLTPSFNVPQPSSIALGASESVALAAPVATKTKGDADSGKLKERDCGGMLQRPVDIPAPEGSSSNKDDEEPWTEEGPDAASPGVDSGDREPKKPERKDDAKTKSPQNEGAEFSFSQLPVRKQLNNGTSTVAEDDGISESPSSPTVGKPSMTAMGSDPQQDYGQPEDDTPLSRAEVGDRDLEPQMLEVSAAGATRRPLQHWGAQRDNNVYDSLETYILEGGVDEDRDPDFSCLEAEPMLDSSATMSRVQLSKQLARRRPELRAPLWDKEEDGYWMFRDSTEEAPAARAPGDTWEEDVYTQRGDSSSSYLYKIPHFGVFKSPPSHLHSSTVSSPEDTEAPPTVEHRDSSRKVSTERSGKRRLSAWFNIAVASLRRQQEQKKKQKKMKSPDEAQ